MNLKDYAMNNFQFTIFLCVAVIASSTVSASDEAYERSLNTANTIRAAWELRRLSESLAEGVDTRCYIAKLAAFQAESLPQSAKLISQYPSPNKDSDAFAVKSTNETMNIYQNNQVQKIADECREGPNSYKQRQSDGCAARCFGR